MNKKIKLRSLFIGCFFVLLFVGLLFRVYYVQVVEASELLKKAQVSWKHSKVLIPKRGTILDRNGNILAQDAPAYTVAVNPKLINSKGVAADVVAKLGPLLGMDTPELRQKLLNHVTAKNQEGEFLVQREIRNEGWKVDTSVRNLIIEEFGDETAMNKMGVYMLEEQKRYYPAGELASHVLGYTDKDGEPQYGVEYYYNELLKGTPGSISYEKDRLGYELPNGEIKYQPAIDGQPIQLTIDQNIQVYIEQALREAYEQYKPKSMTAIAVDPKTMDILGMANLPNFNPNTYWDFDSQADFYNHAALSVYEPGSTFKIVTLAAAVEEGLFDPEAKFMSGRIAKSGWGGNAVHDHDRRGWGEITYLEGLKRSSNVAFVKLGYEMLGEQRLREYIQAFGFGSKSGLDLPGEGQGNIRFRYPIEVANVTFGQGVTVTAIQQIAAISAIANGGKLLEPRLLKAVLDPETKQPVEVIEPKEVRRVISEETAHIVSEYLEQVVSDQEIGTGRRVYIDGYRIAAKTGTAQVVENGKYASDKWVSSFIGFAPVEDPKIALIVIAVEPKISDYRQSGEVVSPVFKDIIHKSLHYYGVATTESQEGDFAVSSISVPNLVGKTIDGAENDAARQSMTIEVFGQGNQVVDQSPAAGAISGAGSLIYVITESAKQIEIPDLSGRSLRDALEICSLLEAQCNFTGEGYVVSQSISYEQGERLVQLKLLPLWEQAEHQESDEDESAEESENGSSEESESDSG